MKVVIPEDHHLVVEIPENIRSGPADLILVIPPNSGGRKGPAAPDAKALAKWDATMHELAADPRPFHALTSEEQRERHRHLRGIGRGLVPTSEEVARAKREEVELEEAKFGR